MNKDELHPNQRNPHESSCEGKEAFATPQAAHKIAKRMARNVRSSHGGNPSAYRCGNCGQWHITRGQSGRKLKRPPRPRKLRTGDLSQ